MPQFSDCNADSNPEEQSFYFWTPLHLAAADGHFVVAEFLIQHGADVNKPDHDGETPLSLASGCGWLKIAHLLLKSGSNVNSQDNDDSTPLHKATQNGHLDTVTLLLDSGADVSILNNNHKTPVDLARDNERVDVERVLAEWKGAVDSQDTINLALLETSSQHPFPDVEKPSVGHGEDPSIPDKGTSLHTASVEGA